eukprot:jgi/Chlat1/1757/Chrsp134S02084
MAAAAVAAVGPSAAMPGPGLRPRPVAAGPGPVIGGMPHPAVAQPAIAAEARVGVPSTAGAGAGAGAGAAVAGTLSPPPGATANAAAAKNADGTAGPNPLAARGQFLDEATFQRLAAGLPPEADTVPLKQPLIPAFLANAFGIADASSYVERREESMPAHPASMPAKPSAAFAMPPPRYTEAEPQAGPVPALDMREAPSYIPPPYGYARPQLPPVGASPYAPYAAPAPPPTFMPGVYPTPSMYASMADARGAGDVGAAAAQPGDQPSVAPWAGLAHMDTTRSFGAGVSGPAADGVEASGHSSGSAGKRSREDAQLDNDMTSSQRDASHMSGGEAAPSGAQSDSALKRARLVWTPQLHKRFVNAVAHLGINNAVPKMIMQLMNVDGLTRENVASHLQKYRLYLKRMQDSESMPSSASANPVQDGHVVGGFSNRQHISAN